MRSGSTGRWLFSSGCTSMLTQQLRYGSVRNERGTRECMEGRRDRRLSICTSNGRWLFSSYSSTGCTRMLTQQLQYESVRNERRSSRWTEWQINDESIQGDWLFLRQGAEIRALQQLLRRNRIGDERKWRRNQNENDCQIQPKTSLDVSWLFLPKGAEFQMAIHIEEDCGRYCSICRRENEGQCLASILFVFPQLEDDAE